MIVDDDAGGDRQARLRGELDIGQHANADHDEISRDVAAVARLTPIDLRTIALDAGDLDAEMDADARRSVAELKYSEISAVTARAITRTRAR